MASVQLRLKNVLDEDVLRACEVLLPICRERTIPFLVNDDPALAAKTGADGVHVGAGDVSVAEARAAVGAEGIVGTSCYDSRHLAMQAAENGVDYVAFGAFFPTITKEARTWTKPDLLKNWSATTTLPSVAIGGITPENCGELARAGADFVAAVSAVWDYPDGPKAAVQAFNSALEMTRKKDGEE